MAGNESGQPAGSEDTDRGGAPSERCEPVVLRRVLCRDRCAGSQGSRLRAWLVRPRRLHRIGQRLPGFLAPPIPADADDQKPVQTGRGADIIINDDPLKPGEALSETQRMRVNQWYSDTLFSRLND